MSKTLKAIVTIVITFFVYGAISLATAWPTKWMVNYIFSSQLLVSTFGATSISFWKAFWLNWLCAGLFRNSSGGSNAK